MSMHYYFIFLPKKKSTLYFILKNITMVHINEAQSKDWST